MEPERSMAMGALRRARLLLLAAPLAALLGGCFLFPAEIGVERADLDKTFAEVDQCALVGDELSSVSLEALRYCGLEEAFEEDAQAALRRLRERASESKDSALLFALSEASYLVGKQQGDRGCFLGSALYASAYLLGDPAPAAYDRRFRWACDLYGQGLLRAFLSADGKRFEPRAGRFNVPGGSVVLAFDASTLPWPADNLRALLPADAFLLHGLKLRLRDSGLGVPLIGVLGKEMALPIAEHDNLLQAGEVPITAFLRVRETALGTDGEDEAVLELHSGFQADTVDVGGRQVPLETDRSVVLAHLLDRPEPWRFSLSGFFQGESATRKNALLLIQPYARGRVPVVFVHGTASSPAYWAELFNTLWFDPVLRQRAQFWFFRYATGNPIAYSAAELRDDLALAVHTLDPEGTDPALRQMVLIGHSQGGLLVKMCAMGSDLGWVEGVLGSPLEEYGFDADELALMKRCFVFDPSPFVSRVVFICTPHRGSFMASKWYSKLVASLVGVPHELAQVGDRLFADESRLPEDLRDRSFTSVSGMDPDNPLQKHVADAPLAPGVVAHSIIAIGDADPRDPAAVQAADDGVVEYASAHIDGVESEDLVPASHSCQSHPVTIESLRRILLEHLKGIP